jgi:hypothetical protein
VRTLSSAELGRSLRQDLRLLRSIGSMVLQYWIQGGRLRREYRRREARGDVLWLDALGETRHREAPLHGKP